MKKFTKFLAVLLALLTAFGVSAGAAGPRDDLNPPGSLDAIPALTLDKAESGSIAWAGGKSGEAWYRFTSAPKGEFKVTVTGDFDVYCTVCYSNGRAFDDASYTDSMVIFSTGHPNETVYICVYALTEGGGDFRLTVGKPSLAESWQDFVNGIKPFFSLESMLLSLEIIPMLPVLLIFGGFFFAPFSVGGTLILVPIGLILLAFTWPFTLYDWWFK